MVLTSARMMEEDAGKRMPMKMMRARKALMNSLKAAMIVSLPWLCLRS